MEILWIDSIPPIHADAKRALHALGHRVVLLGERTDHKSSTARNVAVLSSPHRGNFAFDIAEAREEGVGAIPLMVLLNDKDPEARIHALNAGADDVLDEGFEVAELVARLNALMRRGTRSPTYVLKAGRLVMEPSMLSLRLGREPLHLAPLCYRLLELLMESYPERLTSQVIARTLWDASFRDPPVDQVRCIVWEIRRTIEPRLGERLIVSSQKSGYRVALPVSRDIA